MRLIIAVDAGAGTRAECGETHGTAGQTPFHCDAAHPRVRWRETSTETERSAARAQEEP